MMHGSLLFWWTHVSASLPILEQAAHAAREVGEMCYVSTSNLQRAWRYLQTGAPLNVTLDVYRGAAANAQASNEPTGARGLHLEQQFVACLMGATAGPARLDDDSFREEHYLGEVKRHGAYYELAEFYVLKQILAFIFGYPAESLKYAKEAEAALPAINGTAHFAEHSFYYALTLAALYPGALSSEKAGLLKTLVSHVERLKLWAQHCPENFLTRYALTSAELSRIEGRDLDAIRLYEQAITSARENRFVHCEALAYELASEFYRSRGLVAFADAYIVEAHGRYARWGAHAKVRQIEQRHARLLEHRAAIHSIALPVEHLDLVSVMKASQAISREALTDRLIETLLRVILEQGGAQRGYLILARSSEFSLEAEARLEDGKITARILPSLPIERSSLVPASLVHAAATKGEPVLLRDASASASPFSADSYIARKKPRSMLCLPILLQSKLLGLVYLENNLVPDAFSADRVSALSLLGSQAAISMENASLLTKERQARALSEAGERRSAFLAQASVVLAESLDYDKALVRLAHLCADSIADWSVIDMVEGDQLRRAAGAHANPAQQALLEQLRQRYPPQWDSPHPASQCIRSGQSLYLPSVDGAHLRRLCVDQEHFELVEALGARSLMVVPLVSQTTPLGALTLCSGAEGRFDKEDLALAREVAHRAAMAVENARLHRETETAVRLRDEFLSTASHELRTPIQSLQLAVESLGRLYKALPPASSRMLKIATRQTQRLTALVNQLLDVARIQGGRLALAFEEFDLVSDVQQILGRMQPQIERSGSPVRFQASPHLVGRWDRSRIDQVITNVLSNALTYGDRKPIDLTIEQAGSGEDGRVRIMIHDQGVGIPADRLPYIFERFERASSTRHYGGLGLGLFIARQIVKRHDGTISVVSEEGRGSTFTVELPIRFRGSS